MTAHGELYIGRRCLIMAILNVTVDSFSDGGRYIDRFAAVDRAVELQAQGADLIDIGGESTRPGSVGVPPDEQIARVIPVIREARERGVSIPISIDTRSAGVAAAALDAGADIVNDVSGARHDPDMSRILAERDIHFVIMHMLGDPDTMQNAPRYDDVVAEVGRFFDERANALATVGVNVLERMLVDPGIGFGKTVEHNLELIRHAAGAYGAKWPVVLGASRKRFLGTLVKQAEPTDPGAAAARSRLMGTAATVAHAALSGVDIVRVHDVAEMRAVVDVCAAISGEPGR